MVFLARMSDRIDATPNAKQRREIEAVVDRFRSLSASDKRRYQEMEVRTNFIDPLFAALGWRMDDRAEVERETPFVRMLAMTTSPGTRYRRRITAAFLGQR